MRKTIQLVLLVIILSTLLTACGDKPAVHAILFYSDSCGHCHKVMTEDLPPLSRKYGRQLQILEVNAGTLEGYALFQAAQAHYGIKDAGYPTLVVGDIVLQGSVDIPTQLPGIIESGLASDGIDWPAIPGFVPPER